MQDENCEDSIQVLVRIKPTDQQSIVHQIGNQLSLEKHQFAFDKVFPHDATQEELFNWVGRRLVQHTIEGYNGCVFVYGQTGSGKTHTMIGDQGGLMQRSFHELFARLDRMSEAECLITCSYYELYNEQIIDLLDPKKDKRTLCIRQDAKRGVFVENLAEETAMDAAKLLEYLQAGLKNRHTGETMMNRESSRSHTIFSISLSCKLQVQGKRVLKTPKLHFVDLAGSQRQKMTLSTGERLKEAGSINRSLTTLGMVINALASEKKRTHIPYRDSKLTCLLRDCLGGNSKTFIVATISSSVLCFQQTLSTLNFANRAKMVKVKALINEESLSNNIEHYKEQIRRLKMQLSKLRSQRRGTNQSIASLSKNVELDGYLDRINDSIATMSNQLKSNLCSPALEQALTSLSKLSKAKEEQMNEEIALEGELDRELTDYLICNKELLMEINTKITNIAEIKEGFGRSVFSQKVALDNLKTPSKGEREQYQALLLRRDSQVRQIQQAMTELQRQLFTKELQVRELKRSHMHYMIEESNSSIEDVRGRLHAAEKSNDSLQKSLQEQLAERRRLEKTKDELQMRFKQTKELQVYNEEKYENEKYHRHRLEEQLKEITKQRAMEEEQNRTTLAAHNEMIDELNAKMEAHEAREQDYKNQIQVLSEASQFNTKLLLEYKEKFEQDRLQILELSSLRTQSVQELSRLGLEYQHLKTAAEVDYAQLKNSMSECKCQNEQLRQENKQLRSQYEGLAQELEQHRNEANETRQRLSEGVAKAQTESAQLERELQTNQIETKTKINQQEILILELQKKHCYLTQQYDIKQLELANLQNRYEFETSLAQQSLRALQEAKSTLQKEATLLRQKEQAYQERLLDLQAKVASTRQIRQQQQQLQKSYTELVKQNYKLKGEYSQTAATAVGESKASEQLQAKVVYYEEKFRLMSMEYNKALQVNRKLKQREIALMQRVQYFEESQKTKKIVLQDDNTEEVTKELLLENEELKARLRALELDCGKSVTDSSETRTKLEMEAVREKLVKLVQERGQAKENCATAMNLAQLLDSWERLDQECCRKQKEVAEAIKHEKKLKSQNSFVLKENFMLKEQLAAVQEIADKPDKQEKKIGASRKKVKLNAICEE